MNKCQLHDIYHLNVVFLVVLRKCAEMCNSENWYGDQYACPRFNSRSRPNEIIQYIYVITAFYAVFGVSSVHYRRKKIYFIFCIIRCYGGHCFMVGSWNINCGMWVSEYQDFLLLIIFIWNVYLQMRFIKITYRYNNIEWKRNRNKTLLKVFSTNRKCL